MNHGWLVPAFLLAGVAMAGAQHHKHDGHARRTRALAADALQAGRFEVLLAQHMLGKTVDYDVRRFAERVTEDHVTRNAELEALVPAGGVNAPLVLTPEQRTLWNRMALLALGDADAAYRARAVPSQRKLLSLYESQARSARDPRLRALARRELPRQRERLRQARQLAGLP